MNYDELLDCELCQYRADIARKVSGANRLVMDACIDAWRAFGLDDDKTIFLRDLGVALDEIFAQLYRDMQECDGDATIALPLNDEGHVD